MKIAFFHNYYKLPGGEDTVFELEIDALRAQGHTVVPYTVHNTQAFATNSLRQKLRGALDAPHSRSSQTAIRAFLERERPDISHIHNWFPVISPSIYTAHHQAGIPTVQTLHNYRLGCAAATYYRDGAPCQACRPGRNLPALRHRCYNRSAAGSLVWKRIIDRGWKKRTFIHQVSHYISPSRGVRRRHIEMGLAADSITHIPNACLDPQQLATLDRPRLQPNRQHICFAGRLVAEKGAHILIRAWQQMHSPPRAERQLTIIGTGPQEAELRALARGDDSIQFTGQLSRHEALNTLQQADLLVCPSLWLEPFGMSVIEAMAAGIAVISSDLGGPAEIIADGIDGHLIPAGDIAALSQILSACLNDRDGLKRKGRAARLKYTQNYTAQLHAQRLTQCYQGVLGSEPRATSRATSASHPASLPSMIQTP